MKIRRFSTGAALLAAGALVLGACANTPTDPDSTPTTSDEVTESPDETAEPGGEPTGSVTVAEVNEFSSFNPNTPNGNVDINGKVDLITHSDFVYIDGDLNVVRDESFGVIELVSEDPLTVKYTVNEGVTWSDGVQIDAADLLLSWAVRSGYYDDAVTNDDGDVVEGANYFSYAGSTAGLGLTSLPEVGEDGRSVTLTYSEPYADWEIAFGVDRPAHVVAENAGLADKQALIDLLLNTPEGDPENPAEPNAELQAVASFYNTGFDTTTLPSDPGLYLSSGPYIVSDIAEAQSITLVPNEAYTGDHQAQVAEIVIRIIPDANAQIQALQNGEVDIIAPQASADTLTALEALSGVEVHRGNQLAYDHIDLSFNTEVFQDADVREAFLKTIPRQAILDAIITPLDPEAGVLNSQLFIPEQAAYADAVANNGSDRFAEVDIEGARELLDGRTPEVRILYSSENPNRVDAFQLISASATEAGFQIVDEGDPQWGSRLGDGSYDAAIFGWSSPGVGVSGVPQLFRSNGGGNFGAYANSDVDALADELVVTADTDRQDEIQVEIDKHLFDDGFGLPLFQSVGVTAVADRVGGITAYNPNQNGVFWNVWEWTVNDG